ncbi:MAG: acyltransferase [Planctomyces sp.]|nr:acyltransferase [Planctomyces sp.]
MDFAPRCPRYQSLDLWRGVACLAVVIYHSTFRVVRHMSDAPASVADWVVEVTRHLWIGVPMFFVISGYCIAATADSQRRKPGAIRSYAIRRLRRIYPPFWFALAGTMAFWAICHFAGAGELVRGIGDVEGWPRAWGEWLGNLSLTESWLRRVERRPAAYILDPAWTLCYEEQFYAVVGLAMFVAPRRFFSAMIAVTAFVLGMMIVSRVIGVPMTGFYFDGYWLLFAAGVGVYWALNYGRRGEQRALAALLLAMVVGSALWSTPFTHHGRAGSLGPDHMLIGSLFALLLLALRRWDGRIAESKLAKPLMLCGVMCYSLYLTHWPVVNLVSRWLDGAGHRTSEAACLVILPACVLTALAAGGGFYWLVERRFLNRPGTSPPPVEAAEPDIDSPLPEGRWAGVLASEAKG